MRDEDSVPDLRERVAIGDDQRRAHGRGPRAGASRRRASGPVPQRTASPAIGSAAVTPGSFTAVEAASAAPAANASHGRKRLL